MHMKKSIAHRLDSTMWKDSENFIISWNASSYAVIAFRSSKNSALISMISHLVVFVAVYCGFSGSSSNFSSSLMLVVVLSAIVFRS